MRLFFKRFPLLFSFTLSKLRYAYGVCSTIPSTPTLHYPLIDNDENPVGLYQWLLENCPDAFVFYPSRHGYHAIVFKPLSFGECAKFLIDCPFADKAHVALGVKRGYWFLESYVPLAGLPVQMMRIERT